MCSGIGAGLTYFTSLDGYFKHVGVLPDNVTHYMDHPGCVFFIILNVVLIGLLVASEGFVAA